jgi:hypothetical protein
MARRREAVTESAYLRRVIGDGAINPIGKAPSIGDLAGGGGDERQSLHSRLQAIDKRDARRVQGRRPLIVAKEVPIGHLALADEDGVTERDACHLWTKQTVWRPTASSSGCIGCGNPRVALQ